MGDGRKPYVKPELRELGVLFRLEPPAAGALFAGPRSVYVKMPPEAPEAKEPKPSAGKLTCKSNKRDQPFAVERCGAEAAYMTPLGPQCDACAEDAMGAIREGSCLLAIMADARGTPRQRLLDQYRRIQ